MRPVDVVILAGGLGTRVQSVLGERPKPMAMILGRPFLDLLIADLKHHGFSRFILCVGHRREQIIEHYRERGDAEYVISEEDRPLGTGGAVRHAAEFFQTDPILVLNGDSFCPVDYPRFLAFHNANRAIVSIVVAPPHGRADGGTTVLDVDGRILRFEEKLTITDSAQIYINAGIYLMDRNLPRSWGHEIPFSLEREVFPDLIATQRCYGFAVHTEIVDIGTPERYGEAERKIQATACRTRNS